MKAAIKALLVSLCGCALAADAQTPRQPSPELMRQYETAVNNTVAVVWKSVEPHLSAEQRNVLGRVVVRVEPDSWNVFDIRALVEDGVPIIAIPLGYVIVQDFIDTAVVATQVGGIDDKDLIPYIHLVTDRVRQSGKEGELERAVSSLPSFPQFARISPQKWEQIMSAEGYTATKDVIKISSFAFVLLHELGHHVYPDAPFKIRETQADEFAADVGLRADLAPMLAFYMFAFFSALEGDQSLKKAAPGYPAPLCRGIYFFDRGKVKADADPEFVKFMKARGLWKQWVEAPQKIRKIFAEDGVSCPAA